MRIDTERVITEVHMRPVLWDKKDERYKSRDARESAWREILQELMPDIEDWTEDEKRDADKKIQQRWRTARDTYQKDKIAERSGIGSYKRKRYAHYDLLTFLDSTQPTAVDETNELSEESNLELKPDIETFIETPQPQAAQWMPPKHQLHIKRARRSKLLKRQAQLESEDLAFFESLQPTLKSFNRYQKLMFRTKVLNVAMEMESQIHDGYIDAIPSTSSSRCTDYQMMSPTNETHIGIDTESNSGACDYKFITVKVENVDHEVRADHLLEPNEIIPDTLHSNHINDGLDNDTLQDDAK